MLLQELCYALSVTICGYLVGKLLVSYFQWRLTVLRNIPGPNKRNSFLLGKFLEIRREPFLAPHKRWWKEVGFDAPLIYYSGSLGKKSVLILDKMILKEILTSSYGKQEPRFMKIVDLLKNIIGMGLVNLQGKEWMRHRQMIQPAFHTGFLKASLSRSVPPKMQNLIQYWAATQGREIDLNSHLSALTLDIIGDVAFGHDFGGLESVKQWAERDDGQDTSELAELDDPLMKALSQSLKLDFITVVLFIIGKAGWNRYLNPKTIRTGWLLNKAVNQVIQHARDDKNTTNTGTTFDNKKSIDKQKSLLQVLLEANDNENAQNNNPVVDNNNKSSSSKTKSLTNEELRDEVKTFVMAGHETTSTWLLWALYALSKFPDIQEKVYQDILAHSGGISDDMSSVDLNLNMDAIEQMDYLSAFLNEVLRLYPPVGMFARRNRHQENFGGYIIPPQTRLVISPHLIHRHPHYWDDPDTFQPERWIHDNAEEKDKFNERIRFAFLPFSAGGRNCIGEKFATVEAKLILVHMVRAFILQIAPSQRDTEHEFTSFITMKAKPGLKISVKSRSRSSK
jgi:cytochrome P450